MTDLDQTIKKWRQAIKLSEWVLLPDRRKFMIMWRHYDQFGVRNLETGEQYAFSYQEAARLGLVPLCLCPIDLNTIQVD